MNHKINLPTSWDFVTLKQFAKLQNKLKDDELDIIEKYVDIVSILSNESFSLISKMPIDSLKKAIETISFINELPKDTRIKNEIIVQGKIYTGTIDITKLTAGQYIDIKSFCKDADNIFDNIGNIMAVIYVEKGEKYDGGKHFNRAKLFDNSLMIGDVFGFALFFSTLLNALTEDIITSTVENQNKIMEDLIMDMPKSGDGL